MPKTAPIPGTVEQLLAWEIPAPFVKGQKKPLGGCTIAEIRQAADVLNVMGGDKEDIRFLRHIAHQSRQLAGGATRLEDERYSVLRDYTNQRLAAPTPNKGGKGGKSKSS